MLGPGGMICQKGLKYPSHERSFAKQRRLQRTKNLSVQFEKDGKKQISGELLIHFAWDFFSTIDKIHLCQASPIFSAYGSLRHEAAAYNKFMIKATCAPLNHLTTQSTIDSSRARHIACLLVLCDFDVGKLIRLLRGNYTGDFVNFSAIDKALDTLSSIKPDEGQPIHDFDLLRNLYHHGVPHEATYTCDRNDMLRRNIYNNHKAAHPHYSDIHGKVATDIQKSYAIALPRWILRFIDGIFLAAIGWASRTKGGKTKGRQVNDPSALLHPSDTGALNSKISLKDDCPEVFYQTALRRILIRIFNLRISFPLDDIMAYKDDLVTAFRRVRYHPDISCAHAFVFEAFLILPIGLVFGARDSPAWFCQVSELRAFASQHFSSLGLPIPDQSLIDSVTFDEDDSHEQREVFRRAQPDSKNRGLPTLRLGPHNTFVDDTIMIELKRLIRLAAINSVLSATLFIGDPKHVENPISEEKFERNFRHINDVLGFVIDTRKMIVTYPEEKKDDLLFDLSSVKPWKSNKPIKVRLLAKILGKLRNLAQILPFGTHLSINLQLSLSSYVKRSICSHPNGLRESMRSRMRRTWDTEKTTHISNRAAKDLNFITSLLTDAPPTIWNRPISLLIPRDPHFSSKSDACDYGLGGFSHDLDFQWRILADLLDSRNLHINIKEFLALFINTYFNMISFLDMLKSKTLKPTLATLDGWIFHLFSDNTSSISWMTHASRSRDPAIIRLAHLLSQLIFQFNKTSPSVFQPLHIPGELNEEADALSRPKIYPTYSDVFTKYPSLKDLTPLRPPSKLISLLKRTISGPMNEVQTKRTMTSLFKLEKHSLMFTAEDWAYLTLHSKTSTSTKEKDC